MDILQLVFGLGILVQLLVTNASSNRNNGRPRNKFWSKSYEGITIKQVTVPFQHAEGPHWDSKTDKLFFVDMHKQKIHRLDPTTGEVTHVSIDHGPVGIIIPIENSTDKFIVASARDLLLLTWNSDTNSSDPNFRKLTRVDTDRPKNRFNDGKVDSGGRLWAGTMGAQHSNFDVDPDQGSLYLIKNDLVPVKMVAPVSISNGLAWNKEDNTFYHIDTAAMTIVSYHYDAENAIISKKNTVIDLNNYNISGIPDGMTIDTDGNLWIALFRGSQVMYIDPHGNILRLIQFPTKGVTSVVFGGASLDVLYVTTSRLELTSVEIAKEPLAGSVFAVTGLGVRGLRGNSFLLNYNIPQSEFCDNEGVEKYADRRIQEIMNKNEKYR